MINARNLNTHQDSPSLETTVLPHVEGMPKELGVTMKIANHSINDFKSIWENSIKDAKKEYGSNMPELPIQWSITWTIKNTNFGVLKSSKHFLNLLETLVSDLKKEFS